MAELSFLVRHGEYESFYPKDRLTAAGREQSEEARDELLAKELGGRAYLLSSDASRALETASIIGDGLGLEVIPSQRVRRGSSEWHIVDVLRDFLKESLRQDAGIEPEPERPIIAVVHAPLIAGLNLHSDASKIEHGRVYSYEEQRRDPDYREDIAEFVLSGGLERRSGE